MLKSFHCVWKNATVKKSQIVLHRFASFSVHKLPVNQFDSRIRSNKNSNKQQPFSAYEKYHQIRCISNTDNSYTLNRSENVVSKYKAMESNLKWRDDPVIATLDTLQFKSILRKNILDLVAIFHKYNYEIRIAGGAVRYINSERLHLAFD